MTKFCPRKTFNPDLPQQHLDCDEDDCAWWDDGDPEACAILVIARQLRLGTISIDATVAVPEPVHIRTPY